MAETRELHDPFLNKTVEISTRLTDRLRGMYANGPTMPNGEPEFGWRQFDVPPIQKEAADRIEELGQALAELERRVEKSYLESEMAHLRAENGALRGELGAQAEARVTMLREVFARVHGALDDYASLEPETDETWEIWFHAAFDLAGSKISRVLDEAIERERAQNPVLNQQDGML